MSHPDNVTPLKLPAIPAWRPGAIYWRPLEDGNEITVYPDLTGGAMLCLGPLADQFGYDKSWQYGRVQECLYEARVFDGEGDPGGKWLRATGPDEHGKHVIRRHGEPVKGENFMAEDGDHIETARIMGDTTERWLIDRALPNGKTLQVEGVRDEAMPANVIQVVNVNVMDGQPNTHAERVAKAIQDRKSVV